MTLYSSAAKSLVKGCFNVGATAYYDIQITSEDAITETLQVIVRVYNNANVQQGDDVVNITGKSIAANTVTLLSDATLNDGVASFTVPSTAGGYYVTCTVTDSSETEGTAKESFTAEADVTVSAGSLDDYAITQGEGATISVTTNITPTYAMARFYRASDGTTIVKPLTGTTTAWTATILGSDLGIGSWAVSYSAVKDATGDLLADATPLVVTAYSSQTEWTEEFTESVTIAPWTAETDGEPSFGTGVVVACRVEEMSAREISANGYISNKPCRIFMDGSVSVGEKDKVTFSDSKFEYVKRVHEYKDDMGTSAMIKMVLT